LILIESKNQCYKNYEDHNEKKKSKKNDEKEERVITLV